MRRRESSQQALLWQPALELQLTVQLSLPLSLRRVQMLADQTQSLQRVQLSACLLQVRLSTSLSHPRLTLLPGRALDRRSLSLMPC